MKATRRTIPKLIEKRTEFSNDSGTVRGIKPTPPLMVALLTRETNQLNEDEKSRLRIDAGPTFNGIAYLVMSYETPIAWETKTGLIYKVQQKFSQTTSKHQGMLYLFYPQDES